MDSYCIIGGSGFIGSNLVRYLNSEENEILIIGRSSIPRVKFSENIKYFSGDYGDKGFLSEILANVDYVVNLAYSSVSQVSYTDPLKDIYANLPSHIALFEMVCESAVKKLVIVSSGGTVYGKTGTYPIQENHPTDPISPYGITKLIIEKYALMYHTLYDLPVIGVRPSNAYGEGQLPFQGQGFIPTAIASVLCDKEIIVYGNEGTIRDYIHVSDVVRGIMAALKFGDSGEIYNIGTNIGNSNRDILKIIAPLALADNRNMKVKFVSQRPYDVPSNILDYSKLENISGWKPQIPLKEGIDSMWNHFKQRFQTKPNYLKNLIN